MTQMYLNVENDLSKYLERAQSFPILKAEEEQSLARRWRDHRDADAARQLVGSYLRLVVKIARGYAGYGLDMAELIGEGNVGLMQAVEKFDPELGYRFATYAQWWIRAAIQEYVMTSRSLVKMGTTASQKKLFFNLRRMKNELHDMETGDLSPETVAAIAETLDVPEADVIDMNRRMAARDASLNTAVAEATDREWQDLLVDEERDQEVSLAEREELTHRRRLLEQGMDRLTPRERDILTERRLRDNPPTLDTLGRKYGVSSERIRQIEARAFEKLQRAVKAGGLTYVPERAAA